MCALIAAQRTDLLQADVRFSVGETHRVHGASFWTDGQRRRCKTCTNTFCVRIWMDMQNLYGHFPCAYLTVFVQTEPVTSVVNMS